MRHQAQQKVHGSASRRARAARQQQRRQRQGHPFPLDALLPRWRALAVPWWGWSGAAAALVVIVIVVAIAVGGGGAKSAAPLQLLASAESDGSGRTIDGISCGTHEEAAFHIHAHLAVFVSGTERGVPAGIGIAPPRQEEQGSSGPNVIGGKCFYWLHTHTADGIVHIESPQERGYTLGNFFDIWEQPLSASGVGTAAGKVIAYVDGHKFAGNPRDIALNAHSVVQLDVGTDVPFRSYSFTGGL